ncbi:MAG: DUF2206 domain-containing protein [Candidatus Aenigmatarchaeota archaeon]
MPINCGKQDFLAIVAVLQLIVDFALVFDIPIVRQFIGFIYLTFIPGFITIQLTKMNNLDNLKILLFSLGLSVAFLMFIGLLVNEILSLAGIFYPLSLVPLVIALNIFVLVGGVLAYLRNEDAKLFNRSFSRFSLSALLLIFLPILSIFGVIWVNIFVNNLILLFMIIAISVIFLLALIFKKLISSKFYPLAVLFIAISLLFHSSLITQYVCFADIHLEYFIFQTTRNNKQWNSVFVPTWDILYGSLNSMLSITILPTIYSIILNVDAVWIFKIIYPLIFSFVPLILYVLWREDIGKYGAFAATFFFMSMGTFYSEILGLNRQMIGELFFGMLLLTISEKNASFLQKTACFIIFSWALIISHYSLAGIFLFFLVFFLILTKMLKYSNRNIPVSKVSTFFVLMFTWYIYTSNMSIFESFLSAGNKIFSRLGDFFELGSRERHILMSLWLESPPTILNAVSRAFSNITQILIVVGFVGLLSKKSKVYLNKERFAFTFIALIFLAALLLVPGMSSLLNMTRFYHILLFFLAPLCVIGAEVIGQLVFKRKAEFATSILLIVVLVPYFLFQTGFVYEVAGAQSWSVPLSKYRMDPSILMVTFAYVNGWKAYGAFWLRDHVNVQAVNVYKDWSAHELGSYGMLRYAQYLSNTTRLSSGDMVYLSYLNVIEGVAITLGGRVFNITELSFVSDINLIYSNGGCQIYKVSNG